MVRETSTRSLQSTGAGDDDDNDNNNVDDDIVVIKFCCVFTLIKFYFHFSVVSLLAFHIYDNPFHK